MIVKTSCQHCGIHIEFDAESVNEFVSCPSCGKQTRLLLPRKQANVPPVPAIRDLNIQARLKTFFTVVVAIIILCIVISFASTWTSHKNNQLTLPEPSYTSSTAAASKQPLSTEEKSSRENILKALMEVQSATAVGVTRDRYGGILIKADSTLNFEKTKLSDYRHYQYLSDAKEAIRFYSKANGVWDSYFKYDWMREKHEALMFDWDFKDLHECGVSVNEQDYPQQSDSSKAYMVPFDECLSLYWKGADVFIEKMKAKASQ